MTLSKLNALSSRDAVTLFRQCCGSLPWSRQMEAERPFRDLAHLHEVAGSVWAGLPHAMWREAFAHHPKIGDMDSLRKRFPATAPWAEREQSGAATSSDAVLRSLESGNALYEAKFGYLFIICATGKSAEEMLAHLNERLSNFPEDEIRIAGREQAAITALRLEKLLQD